MEDAKDFLLGKGICHNEDIHTYIKLFCFEGNHFLLSQFVIDKFFVIEVCSQYLIQSTYFEKKRKRQFIQFSLPIPNIQVRNSTYLIDILKGFKSFQFKESLILEGFNLESIFTSHLLLVGYSNIFSRNEENIEGNKVRNSNKRDQLKTCGSLDTFVNTNTCTRQEVLQTNEGQSKKKERGKSSSNVEGVLVHDSNQSSSLCHRTQENILIDRENNEGCFDDVDERNWKLEFLMLQTMPRKEKEMAQIKGLKSKTSYRSMQMIQKLMRPIECPLWLQQG